MSTLGGILTHLRNTWSYFNEPCRHIYSVLSPHYIHGIFKVMS